MKIVLCPFDEDFLTHSWKWLNDPDIKKLTFTPDFSKQSQLNWYKNLKGRKDYLIWGIMVDDVPVGACGLKNLTVVDGEYWGYIGEKSYWGKGVGFQMMSLIEKKAKELNLKSLWLQVLDDNTRAIKLYNSLNYGVVSKENNFIIMKKLL